MIGNFARSLARVIAHRQALIADFDPSLGHVLVSEGGYVDDPQDPGGATDHGITQSVYDDWRRSHGQKPRDVRLIDPSEISAIYRARYWGSINGDYLPAGVDYCVFDFAVNSGVKRASAALQRAVGVNADGHIGEATMAAVNAADPHQVINAVSANRLAFLETLPTWPHFGAGWSRRVAEVETAARAMA